MKQRITVDQLNELTSEQREKLREWWLSNSQIGDRLYVSVIEKEFHLAEKIMWKPNEARIVVLEHRMYVYEYKECLPLLSIGQMIELLVNKGVGNSSELEIKVDKDEWSTIGILWSEERYSPLSHGRDGLCNALWEAVKLVL